MANLWISKKKNEVEHKKIEWLTCAYQEKTFHIKNKNG